MWKLLQTQDQNEKMYNALGRGGGFKKCIVAGIYSSDFKVRVAGDHRPIAS